MLFFIFIYFFVRGVILYFRSVAFGFSTICFVWSVKNNFAPQTWIDCFHPKWSRVIPNIATISGSYRCQIKSWVETIKCSLMARTVFSVLILFLYPSCPIRFDMYSLSSVFSSNVTALNCSFTDSLQAQYWKYIVKKQEIVLYKTLLKKPPK